MFALSILVTSMIGLLVARSIYRLYFHPLRHIPGPKLAAISHSYQFYFDVLKEGKFIFEIDRLHQIYGPIVRINPEEVHINDPDYYQEVYAASTRRREKDPIYTHGFGLPGSSFSTTEAELHRIRREPLNKLFSKNAINDIVPLIREKVERLLFHIEEGFHSKKVIHIDSGFVALTADVIHQYVYGYSEGNLEKEDFDHNARDGINGMFRIHHVLYFFPMLLHLESLPMSILRRLSVHMEALVLQKTGLYNKGIEAARALGANKISDKTRIIDVLVNPDIYSAGDRDPIRVKNESMSLLTAGTETTGRALAVATFHIYSKPHILSRMREELVQAMPDPNSEPTWTQLEQLPYLSAVVNESFRVASGTSGRFSRVAPTETLMYNDLVIPPGTPISSSNHLMLRHPKIFPNPDEFDPDRWIRAAEKGVRLEKYLVNFSKGSRSCLGRHLAIAEMFLTLASLIRRVDIEIHDTPQANIECGCDFGVPYPKHGNLSVCTLITGLVQE